MRGLVTRLAHYMFHLSVPQTENQEEALPKWKDGLEDEPFRASVANSANSKFRSPPLHRKSSGRWTKPGPYAGYHRVRLHRLIYTLIRIRSASRILIPTGIVFPAGLRQGPKTRQPVIPDSGPCHTVGLQIIVRMSLSLNKVK